MSKYPCPTVKDLLEHVKDLTKSSGFFQQAWDDSFADPSHCCEQGGFIYVDLPIPAKVTKAYISHAPKGATMNQRTKGDNASIDLNKPGIKQDNVVLVANFHTHPLSKDVGGSPQPSKSDIENAYHRGVPGIVISREGIYSYGPEERASTSSNPKGYAAAVTPGARVKLERDAKQGVPSVVKLRQWPEGTEKVKDKRAAAHDAPAVKEGPKDVVVLEWSDEGVQYGKPLPEK